MGKNILVLAATSKEITPFIQAFKTGDLQLKNNTLDILVGGIGLTATAYQLTKQLAIKNYDLVIQAGVAGCFDTSVPLGKVLAVKQDSIADQSVVEMKKLQTLFDLKLVPHSQHPYKNSWLINPHKEFLKLSGIKQVKGISVNQISTSKQMIKFYRETFNPVTESMEGAALHYVCLMENVQFIQLRSISNYIGERNKKKWDMQDSINNLNSELIGLIEKL
jgi:futalosine hydrolase